MMITEQNCEEYLLMYVDDELTGAERSAVEDFIRQHPQYALLLEALQQTKLPQEENLILENKNALYKTGNEIGIDNYEEYFLLYTDNELSSEDREKAERFVLQHPQLQPAFTLLQQTKLPHEDIEYKDKQSLYREEKKRRVLPLYVARMSVAAALIAAMVFTWQLLSDKSNHLVTPVAIQTPANRPVKTGIKPAQPLVLPKQETDDAQKAIAQQVSAPEKKKDAVNVTTTPVTVSTKQHTSQQETAIAPLVQNNTQPVVAKEAAEPLQQKQPAAETDKGATTTAAVLKPLDTDNDQADTQTATLLSDDDNAPVQQAVYKELKTDDESQTLYVGSFQFNKAKVNGFLKSASHLLGSRSKQNAE